MKIAAAWARVSLNESILNFGGGGKSMESDEREAVGAADAEELKDPMSGYASADALGAQAGGESVHSGRSHEDVLKDSMSGYASADAIATKSKVDPEGTDQIHTEELKDSMSGYASADALGAEENE